MQLSTEERRMLAVQEANGLYSYSEETGYYTSPKGTELTWLQDCGAIILNTPVRAISSGQAAWYRATELDPNENGARIYHKDGDATNNKFDNLMRLIGPSIGCASNASNRNSEYAGVILNMKTGKWEAHFGLNRKHYYVGSYATEYEAFLARNAELMKMHRTEYGDFPITVAEALE